MARIWRQRAQGEHRATIETARGVRETTSDFLPGGSVADSWTGSMITNPSAANGNQTAPSTNTYVNFFDLPIFDALRLTSTNYAFESDNHAYATVPEPGTLVVLATGLLGLALFARRRAPAPRRIQCPVPNLRNVRRTASRNPHHFR